MSTTRARIPRGRRAAIAGLTSLSLAACSTLDVVGGFNVKAHGPDGDPHVSPEQASQRLLERLVVDEMTDAYFKGEPDFEAWFDWATKYAGPCIRNEAGSPCAEHSDAGVAATSDAARKAPELKKAATARRVGAHRFQAVRENIRTASDPPPWRKDLGVDAKNFCDQGAINTKAERLADALRFENAFARVVVRAAAWCDEGLIKCNTDPIVTSISSGFDHARKYLANRKWKRDARRANVGLVLSGGASNGMFSAGATWQLLKLVDACTHAPHVPNRPDCGDIRFQLISGTSAGSMVAAVVDLYNAQYENDDRVFNPNAKDTELDSLVHWFTCLPAEQLYCADSELSLELFTSKTGIATFDGVRYLMGKSATEKMRTNASELFLNTVDFQSGFLLAASDQDPLETKNKCDIVEHALSSIPEPLIANAITRLKLDGFANADGGVSGFFLDGGVLSVLPLMPVIRHGADRVVMVSNGPSLISGSEPPGNALDLVQRYIDISVNGAGADGVTLAQSFAEIRRTSEQAACLDFFKGACTDARCTTFCAGDVYRACGASPPEDASNTLGHERSFPLVSIYRDDDRVDPSEGYSFAPELSYPMFLAGANAVRQRCATIAPFLGVPDAWLPDVSKWCSGKLPQGSQKLRCPKMESDKPVPEAPLGVVRACGTHPWKFECPPR